MIKQILEVLQENRIIVHTSFMFLASRSLWPTHSLVNSLTSDSFQRYQN